MSIRSAKAKYEGIKETYKYTVDNLNATAYEVSMLYTQDNALQDFFTSKIKLGLETFRGNLRKIDTNPENYNYKNTGDKKQELTQVITDASSTIFKYTDIIREKSKEVFDEYTEKFGAFGRLYEGNKDSALKLIGLAEEADSKYNNPPEYTKTNSLGEVVTDYAALENYRSNWSNKRDTYLRQAENQMDFMEKNRASMQELLDKGLKKV